MMKILFPGSLFVMGAGLTAEWEPVASRLADPALSACAAIILVIFNYPFSKSQFDFVFFKLVNAKMEHIKIGKLATLWQFSINFIH